MGRAAVTVGRAWCCHMLIRLAESANQAPQRRVVLGGLPGADEIDVRWLSLVDTNPPRRYLGITFAHHKDL